MRTFTKLAGLGAVALLGWSFASPPGATLSNTVDYEFRKDVVGGMGIKSLADLRGKPVLVEFWGTR